MISILFLSRSNSQDDSAYAHRLSMLRRSLENEGMRTSIFHLGDNAWSSHTVIPTYIPRMTKVFKKYDLIHAGGSSCAYVANVCKPFHGRKVVCDVHGDRIQEILHERRLGNANHRLGYFPIVKASIQMVGAYYFSDHFIPVSVPLKKVLIARGIQRNKISIIRNGVDIDCFKPNSRSRATTKRKKFVFTYAGKFQSYQAVDDFIDAAARMDCTRFIFRIIGFSEEDINLKERIKEKLGNRAELISLMPQDRLLGFLQDSDVLVIPRRRSKVTEVALPTKFAEYIAIGKPVIVSDVDETASFVEEHRCGLVYNRNASGLLKSMHEMATLPVNRLKEMGQNGRRLAESVFDWKVIGKAYATLIQRIHLTNGSYT